MLEAPSGFEVCNGLGRGRISGAIILAGIVNLETELNNVLTELYENKRHCSECEKRSVTSQTAGPGRPILLRGRNPGEGAWEVV